MAKKKAEEAEAGPSKMSMVREALEQLGSDAKPKDIREYVKAKYSTDIPATMISSYKSNITSGGGSGRSRMGRGGGNGAVSVSDLEALKTLVDRLGAKQMEHLVKVLGK
jgi:hypothetical protein